MRYAITVDVDVPRDELVALVDDPVTLPEWHEGLLAVEALDGAPGIEGSRTRLVYDRAGQPVEIVETIVENRLPGGRTCVEAAKGSCRETRHEFEALGPDATRWTQHVTYAFTGPGMAVLGALMPGSLARRTRRQMRLLKLYAERVTARMPSDPRA